MNRIQFAKVSLRISEACDKSTYDYLRTHRETTPGLEDYARARTQSPPASSLDEQVVEAESEEEDELSNDGSKDGLRVAEDGGESDKDQEGDIVHEDGGSTDDGGCHADTERDHDDDEVGITCIR